MVCDVVTVERAAVGEHVAQALRRVRGVQRQVRGARLQDPEERDNQLQAAVHAQRHPVFDPDPPPAEVVRKLEAVGPDLGHPHSTSIRQTEGLRERRPRRGSSSWRGIYRRIGETFVIAAVCPEAQNSAHGFRRGCDAAAERLAELEE